MTVNAINQIQQIKESKEKNKALMEESGCYDHLFVMNWGSHYEMTLKIGNKQARRVSNKSEIAVIVKKWFPQGGTLKLISKGKIEGR